MQAGNFQSRAALGCVFAKTGVDNILYTESDSFNSLGPGLVLSKCKGHRPRATTDGNRVLLCHPQTLTFHRSQARHDSIMKFIKFRYVYRLSEVLECGSPDLNWQMESRCAILGPAGAWPMGDCSSCEEWNMFI